MALGKNQLNDPHPANETTPCGSRSIGVALMTPLAVEQATLNGLAHPGIESFMAISDETWGIKEYQRDRTSELEQFGINQDRQIAEEQVVTGRTKLAIQRAIDEYTLAVKIYDAKVKSLLMGTGVCRPGGVRATGRREVQGDPGCGQRSPAPENRLMPASIMSTSREPW